MFHGSLVALVTPMHEDNSIDYEALKELIEWHIQEGTDGLVILGTTGESVTIEADERIEIIRNTLDQVNNRIPVIVGAGSNSTHHTISLTTQAMELGADAVLLVTPYYNKPTQEGLYQHFKTVANAVPIPQILYNVPSRTHSDLLPETICRLSGCSNIVGIKEATGDLTRIAKMQQTGFDLYSGDDKTALEFMLQGGKGWISVVGNIMPKLAHEMSAAALTHNEDGARQIEGQIKDLVNALSAETNPIPIKWALMEMGKIKSGIRLPLTPLSQQYHVNVRKALLEAKLIH